MYYILLYIYIIIYIIYIYYIMYIYTYIYIYICFCEFNMIQYQFNLGIKLPTVAAVDSANLHEWLSADWSLASEHGRIHGKNVVFCFTFTVLPLS